MKAVRQCSIEDSLCLLCTRIRQKKGKKKKVKKAYGLTHTGALLNSAQKEGTDNFE